MKKSITKYHQPCNTLIIKLLCVILASKKASPSITKYHQLFCTDSLQVHRYLASIYKLYNQHASAIYFAGEQFSSPPGCTQFVHPHVHGL